MAKHPRDLIDTGEREAILEQGRAEGRAEVDGRTPRPDESTETIRRLARAEANPIARNEVQKHADFCRDEGALCSVASKVDKLNRSVLMATGVLLLLGSMMPFFWARLSTRLDTLDRMQLDIMRNSTKLGTSSSVEGVSSAPFYAHLKAQP